MGEKVSRFEDLEVWKEGMRLATKIYRALNACRDYGLRDQMQRAAVSIPSNIAEGYERNTNKDFIHFLYIAKGSCGEENGDRRREYGDRRTGKTDIGER